MTEIIGDHRRGTGPAQELRPEDPRKVGPYWLLGRLGSGGMGQVFLGRSPGKRLVAVKVVRAELAEQAEFRNRFAREVAAARTVSGLFTAAVVDADVDAPVPWLATAYVPGPSLAEAVTSHGPLPPASVRALAAGLAEGLGAIHAAGIVHRDLKPSNVLLAEDGPRVIDFGISRAVEATMLTSTGEVFGSPAFMSPEQARGGQAGPPSDVFSLGAVLAFAATGEGPFGAGSSATVLYRVVFTPPDTSGLPDELRPLVERCLAKDPGQRPTTEQLLAELDTEPPTTGWLPAPITQAFSSRPPLEPGPVAPTAADDLPPMPPTRPDWAPRASAWTPSESARTPSESAWTPRESALAPREEPTSSTRAMPPLEAAGIQVPGGSRGRERRNHSGLGLAVAAAVATFLITYLALAMITHLPPFGGASSAPSSPAPTTTTPASTGPRSSPVTSPATTRVTTPPTSPVTSPVTTPPTSPVTSPVTTPPTSPATSPAVSPAATTPAVPPAATTPAVPPAATTPAVSPAATTPASLRR